MGASSATCLLFLLWFFAATFFLSFFEAESNVSCNEKDKQALLKFKRSLIFPPAYSQDDCFRWDCFGWNKVHCDKKTGRVTKLSVTSVGGEISPSLLELEFLNYLDLSNNDFNCTPIPSFLGSMGSLTHLDLRSSNFCGLIPPQLGNLSSLHYLHLGDNFALHADNLHWVSSLSSIRYLDLSSTDLHGEVDWLQIMSELPHCWRYWQFLTHLDLGSNEISGRIPHSMGSLVALQSLYLRNNSIYGDLPSSLKKCSNLRLIDIGENPLSVTIPPWIGEMTSLMFLRLRSNGFKGYIPLQICELSSLIVLDLGNNSLSGPIPNCLKNISAMTIPKPIFEAQFSFNSAYGNVRFRMDGVYIENLKLVSKGTELEYKENLKFVKIIDLSSNNLSGSIPSEISVLSELCFLNLSRNQLIGKIPEKIGIMKKLESIDLSQNHLSGEIPLNLSSLTFLSHLDLSYNNLSGKIPLGPQLQTFDALSYIGNPQLCGNPLPRNCTIGEESQNRTPIGKTEVDSNNSNFYIGMGVGFAVGFWAVCGVLFFNKTWRHAYFRFFDDMKDWVYVTTMLNVNWLLEKLRSYHL